MQNLTTFLQGALMGLAEIIPGVSGSTLALIMGIYDEFVDLLHGFSDVAKAMLSFIFRRSAWTDVITQVAAINWKFCILLVTGMLASLALLSNVFSYTLKEYPQHMNAIFFGMILGSILVPWRQIGKVTPKSYLIAFLVAAITFLALGINKVQPTAEPNMLIVFVGGVVAITGMVLPGVSGSFILLLMGLYEFVIDALKAATRLEITADQGIRLAIFVCGVTIGFLLFVRVIKLGLSRVRDEMMAAMTGLLLGSLRALWPFFERNIYGEGKYDFVDVPVLPNQLQSVSPYLIVGLVLVACLGILLLNRRQVSQASTL